MNDKGQPTTPTEDNLNSISLDKLINIDEIKDNSVIVFRTEKPNQSVILAIKNFIDRYGEKMEKKNCSLLALGSNAKLELLSEEEMNKAGWERKNKSNLILPN